MESYRPAYKHCLRCDVLYQVGRYTVHQRICAKTRPPRREYQRKVSRSEVVAMLDDGMTQSQIAREVGLSRERIRQILKEAA